MHEPNERTRHKLQRHHHSRDEIIKLAPPSAASIVATAPFRRHDDDTCGPRPVSLVVAIHVIRDHVRDDEEEKDDDRGAGGRADVRIVQRGGVDRTRRDGAINSRYAIAYATTVGEIDN